MKKMLTSVALLVLASVAAQAQSRVLNVPSRVQEHSQWCWAATSKMVLDFRGGEAATQCQLVNYAMGINYACGSRYFDWNSYANRPAPTSWITSLLNAGGVPAYTQSGSLSLTNVQRLINANKPMVILWTWKYGGGHFVTLKGYNGSNLLFQDPWPGDGAYWRSHAATVNGNDRYWNNSAIVR